MAAVSFSAGRDIDDKGGDKSSTKAYEDMVEIEKMLEGTTRGDPLAMDPGKKLENLQPGILASWHPGIRMLSRCFLRCWRSMLFCDLYFLGIAPPC